jgi:hypothetical protein
VKQKRHIQEPIGRKPDPNEKPVPFLNTAPGKVLIPVILKQKGFDDVFKFYNFRTSFCEYPLISDRLMSYGLFDDLTDEFRKTKEPVTVLIDHAAEIADKEGGDRFIDALFLLCDFCTVDYRLKPTKKQIENITALKSRVEHFANDGNLLCFWKKILGFLEKDEAFDKSNYEVGESREKPILSFQERGRLGMIMLSKT